LIKLDVLHNISSLGSVVGDDTAVSEVSSAGVLELVKLSRLLKVLELLTIHDFIVNHLDVIEHSLGGHESRAIVNNEGAAIVIFTS
jgi:hypothetical protein